MKTLTKTLFVAALVACSFAAQSQENQNVNNQYGPPNFTGGTVNTTSESYAVYEQDQLNEVRATDIASVYPNPAQSASLVSLVETASNPVTLYVVNLNGTILRSYRYNGGSNRLPFDVGALPDGVYSIQVQERGKTMQSIELLKQN